MVKWVQRKNNRLLQVCLPSGPKGVMAKKPKSHPKSQKAFHVFGVPSAQALSGTRWGLGLGVLCPGVGVGFGCTLKLELALRAASDVGGMSSAKEA